MVYEGEFEVTHVLANGTKLTDAEMKKHVVSDHATLRVVASALKNYWDEQNRYVREANRRR